MPGYDGTGPEGSGPTGLGLGPCGSGDVQDSEGRFLGFQRGWGGRRGARRWPRRRVSDAEELTARKRWLERELASVNSQLTSQGNENPVGK